MKLSKLLKKVSVAVSVLMIAGMLAACSSPSGGSSSGSGSGDGTENNGKTPAGQGTGDTGNPSSEKTDEEGITAKYGDIIFVEGMPLKNKTAFEGSFTSGTDYSVSGNVYTFTSSGLDKYMQLMGQAMKPAVSNPVAIVVYKNNAMMVLDQEQFAAYGSKLTEGTDYTLAANNRIILLTKAGYDKMKDGDDSEEITSSYHGVRDGYYSLWYNNQCWGYIKYADFSSMVTGLKMTIPNDYSMEATEKKVIFTKTGAEKFLASTKK